MKKNEKKAPAGKAQQSKRVALIVLCAVLALILVLLILGTAYMEQMMGLINRNHKDETISASDYQEHLNQTETMPPNFAGEIIDPDDIVWGDHDGVIETSEEVINIMLIGQDRRPGEGRTRSDTMILCTINKNTNNITLTSFMRDMYIQIPGYYDDRINVSYMLGGMELLNKCLETNFGVQVDGNIEVDFGSFVDVIDLVDGVDIALTDDEAWYLNENNGWSLTGGVCHMTGKQALEYARIRALDSDFGRTSRQRNVVNALFAKAKEMSLGELNGLLKDILPMLTTDMSNAEILGYALDIFPMLSGLSITNQRIPADGTYRDAWVRDMLVLIPDLAANRELLVGCMK